MTFDPDSIPVKGTGQIYVSACFTDSDLETQRLKGSLAALGWGLTGLGLGLFLCQAGAAFPIEASQIGEDVYFPGAPLNFVSSGLHSLVYTDPSRLGQAWVLLKGTY